VEPFRFFYETLGFQGTHFGNRGSSYYCVSSLKRVKDQRLALFKGVLEKLW